ncbi:MAG: hypothetical protein ACTS8Z_02485 [Candidatus Limnocylindrales bacterium]
MTTDDRMPDPLADPTRTEGLDPGAFVGQQPERQAQTIPGGVRPDDERIAAHSTQVGDEGGVGADPAGHREVDAGDDVRREAGQDR